jgi:hypothetical protein
MFLYSTASRPALGSTLPLIQWVPGTKQPERQVDHSPTSIAKVDNDGAILQSPVRLQGVALNELNTETTLHFTLLLDVEVNRQCLKLLHRVTGILLRLSSWLL